MHEAKVIAEGIEEQGALRGFRGLDSEALVHVSKQIRDAAEAKSLIAAAIEEGVDDIPASKIVTHLAKALGVERAALKHEWKKQAAAHNAALAPTDEERAEAAAKEAEKAAADREAAKASLMSQIGWLATSPDILMQAVQFLWDEGVAGERSALIALNLFMAGRMHTTMPMALLRTGAPASGKNFVVEKALSMLPPGAVVHISGASAKALAYMQEPLANRIVYVKEAAALLDSNGKEKEFAGMLRVLISEGRLDYHTVAQEEPKTERGKPVRRLVALHLEQEGPISVVMTSARDNVEAELLTRVVLSPADESAEQTIRAARKSAARVSGQSLARQSRTTRDDWVAIHRWLELSGPFDVVIPLLDAFVACLRPGPLRQRRDNRAVIAATSASAILHSAQRQKDAQGCIIADIADYGNAFEALNDGLATAYAPIVSPGVISVVKALEDMLAEQKAEVEKKLQEWRKKNPQAANGPPPQELLPVTTVRATHSQLTRRLGLAAKDLIGQRLRAALDAAAIVRANPGAARSAGGEYQIVATSAALAAGKSASTALPHPTAVAAMQADPTRLAEILSRIDDGIAANEQATPGSPGLQAATAIANGGRDTDAEINQF
jgi:hypothetical protein